MSTPEVLHTDVHYSLALITRGSVPTLVRRGMASDTQQICAIHSESTVRLDAEDHDACETLRVLNQA